MIDDKPYEIHEIGLEGISLNPIEMKSPYKIIWRLDGHPKGPGVEITFNKDQLNLEDFTERLNVAHPVTKLACTKFAVFMENIKTKIHLLLRGEIK